MTYTQNNYLEITKKNLIKKYTQSELDTHRLWRGIWCYENVYLKSASKPMLFHDYMKNIGDENVEMLYLSR